ncbi:MAG: VOC family protein [Acidimicrobiia bacterium]
MQKITPCIWFTRNAEEAVDFYLSVFPISKIVSRSYYPNEGLADFQQEFAGKTLTIDFELFGQRYTALNAGEEFTLNESLSFQIFCKDQAEIDYYQEKLSAVPESEVCGWVKDKFGLSWQIVPENIEELMKIPGSFERLMKMSKISIAELKGE